MYFENNTYLQVRKKMNTNCSKRLRNYGLRFLFSRNKVNTQCNPRSAAIWSDTKMLLCSVQVLLNPILSKKTFLVFFQKSILITSLIKDKTVQCIYICKKHNKIKVVLDTCRHLSILMWKQEYYDRSTFTCLEFSNNAKFDQK